MNSEHSPNPHFAAWLFNNLSCENTHMPLQSSSLDEKHFEKQYCADSGQGTTVMEDGGTPEIDLFPFAYSLFMGC